MTHLPIPTVLRPGRHPQAGFTLIEVMVAILIMAIISVISWRGLDSITQASGRLDAGAQASAELLNTLRQLERDVAWRADGEMIAAPPDHSRSNSPRNPPPHSTALLPRSLVMQSQARDAFSLEILRGVPGTPGQWQRVRWRQQGDTLYRNAGAGSSTFPLPAPAAVDGVAVLKGIHQIGVRAWRAGQGWQDPLVSTQGRLQPEGLELMITLRTPQGDHRYRRVMLLD